MRPRNRTPSRRAGPALLAPAGLLLLALAAPTADALAQQPGRRSEGGGAAAYGTTAARPGQADRSGSEAGRRPAESQANQRSRQLPARTRPTGCTRAVGQGLDKCLD